MAESIDISALDGYFREHKEDIFVQNMVPSECVNHMTLYTDVRDEMQLPSLEIGNMVKGYDGVFAPANNTLVMSKRTLKVRPLSTELTINPQLLRKEWIAKLQRPGFSEANLPFEAFIMQKVMEKIREELELQAIAKGVSTWPTKPTSASGAYDGFLKIIADEIVATTLTPVVTGAITVANAIESLEEVYDAAGGRLQATPTKMYMSKEVHTFYHRQFRADYGGNTNNGVFEKTYLEGSSGLCELVPLRAWGASQRVVLTTADNMVIGIDSESDFANIKSEMNKRNLDIWADYQQGVQINTVNDDIMVVNDRT